MEFCVVSKAEGTQEEAISSVDYCRTWIATESGSFGLVEICVTNGRLDVRKSSVTGRCLQCRRISRQAQLRAVIRKITGRAKD